MEDKAIKVGITGLLALSSASIGWVGTLIVIFVLCLALDMASGFAGALKNGEWKSSIARNGLWKKLGSLVIIGVAGFLEMLLILVTDNIPALNLPDWYSMIILPIVVVWSILTELGSIIENAGELGAPLPPFLMSAIKILKVKVEATNPTLDQEKDNETV